jgi:hypothetical protein
VAVAVDPYPERRNAAVLGEAIAHAAGAELPLLAGEPDQLSFLAFEPDSDSFSASEAISRGPG